MHDESTERSSQLKCSVLIVKKCVVGLLVLTVHGRVCQDNKTERAPVTSHMPHIDKKFCPLVSNLQAQTLLVENL